MNEHLQEFNHNFPIVYSYFVKYDEIKENPVNAFLKILHKGKGLKVNIPSVEDDNWYKLNNVKPPGRSEISFKNPTPFADFSPKKMPTFGYTRSPSYPTKEDKFILRKLKPTTVYSVVNRKREIIVASPRSLKTPTFFDWVYYQYFDNFIWTKDQGPVNVALYFMNEEDATLYLHEICAGDPRGIQKYGIHIEASGLDNYYHLNKTSPPRTQVKLVADLTEIEIAIKYAKDNPKKVFSKQKYTSDSFKGTPIYLLPDALNQYEFVFFSKKNLDKFLKSVSDVKHPEKGVKLYNLENTLSEMTSKDYYPRETVFVTTKDLKPVEYTSREIGYTRSQKVLRTLFKETGTEVLRFCKGMVWLLTSDTLPTEDKAW
jgi:hypothetical protein